MDRFRRSWALAVQSWNVMRSHPSLAIFPIISGFTTLAVSLSFIVPILLSMNASGMFASGHQSTHNVPILYYVVSFCYYLVSYFVVVFFNVALIHCSNKILNNEETSVGDGIKAAVGRLGPILGWSLVGATVGVILRAIAERVGIIGQIVVALLGGAWNIVTFFVVPTLAIEGVGPITAIKTSFETIKKTWGETLIGNIGVSYAIGLLSLIPIPILIIAGVLTQSVWVIVGLGCVTILYWLALAVISSCLTGIYTTAVYYYARTGTVPNVFTSEQIQMAFLPGKETKVAGYIRRKF